MGGKCSKKSKGPKVQILWSKGPNEVKRPKFLALDKKRSKNGNPDLFFPMTYQN